MLGAGTCVGVDPSIPPTNPTPPLGGPSQTNHSPPFPTPQLTSQELESLDPASASVYKMMGPALLRVEVEDARQNVAKRLELIKAQM